MSLKRLSFPGILLVVFSHGIVVASGGYFSSAQSLAQAGIISPQSSEAGYRLSSPISRAEMMKIAVKLSGAEQRDCRTSSARTFGDVSITLGDLCGYIEQAVEAGIIRRGTTFRPGALVTRAEMAKILLGAVGESPSTTSTSSFTDTSGLGDLAGYINRVAELGCTGTTTNNMFHPKSPATRGEVFEMAVCLSSNGSDWTASSTQTTSTNNTSTQNPNTQTTQGSQSTTSSTNPSSSASYVWSTTSYGTCSKTCGGGVQSRTISCKKTTDNSVVADSFCIATGITKPVSQKLCNVNSCSETTHNTVPVPTVTLTASPMTVASGGITTLTWKSTNTTTCQRTGVGGKWSDVATSGTLTTIGMSKTTTFQLSCAGTSGTGSTSVTVNVQGDSIVATVLPTNWPYQDTDPGYGLWIPKGSSGVYVADPETLGVPGSAGSSLQYPGCLNYRPYGVPALYNKCEQFPYYMDGKYGTDVKVILKKGETLALRYRGVHDTAPYSHLTFAGLDGGGETAPKRDVAISEIPGDFNVSAECRSSKPDTHGNDLFMSNGDSPTITYDSKKQGGTVVCRGADCQKKTWTDSVFNNGKSMIKFVTTSTGTISYSAIATCKIVPGKKYYVNIRNQTDPIINGKQRTGLLSGVILSRFFSWGTLAGGHVGPILGGQDAAQKSSGVYRWYPTSAGVTSEYGADYAGWYKDFKHYSGIGRRVMPYFYTHLNEYDGFGCGVTYEAPSNTIYADMYSGGKLVCEPGTPSTYAYRFGSPNITTVRREVTNELGTMMSIEGLQGSHAVNIQGDAKHQNSTATIIGKGGKTMSDVQNELNRDFDGGKCNVGDRNTRLPTDAYDQNRSFILGMSNPTNCAWETTTKINPMDLHPQDVSVIKCDFTYQEVTATCQKVTSFQRGSSEEIEKARNKNPLPYPFFIGNTDPLFDDTSSLWQQYQNEVFGK